MKDLLLTGPSTGTMLVGCPC
uniref:Glycine-rich domain-containing protein 1 n=1 Tax=Rhizophora mucronata TaxID=61149 RepID=A0A2P2Q613_RHIMU